MFDQDYENLEVIMVDGGSTDGSMDIIKSFEPRFTHIIHEADNGQYDAVQKGFDKSTGDLMAWINSDDMYIPGAFRTVAELFSKFDHVNWIMGYPGEIDRNDVLFRRIALPWARWSKWRYYSYDFQFIQQESCFWRRSLWELAGAKMKTSLRLAGDLELWMRFFRHAELYTTISCLAAFRQHSDHQRSRAHRDAYLEECRLMISDELKTMATGDRFKAILLRVFGVLLWPLHFYEIPGLKFLYHRVYGLPPLINYDVANFEHVFSEAVIKLPPIFLNSQNITRETFRNSSQ